MSNLVSISNQDILNDICYSHPKKVQGGCYISNLYIKNQNDNFPVYLQTPTFLFSNLKIEQNYALVEITETDKLSKFFDLVVNIENRAKETIFEKSQEWFYTTINQSKLDELFSSKITEKDNKRILQLKIPLKESELQLDVIDKDNKKININEIENKMIVGIIQIDELKFLKSKTLLELNLIKMQLQNNNFLDLITSCNEDIIINKNNNIQFIPEEEDNDIEDDNKNFESNTSLVNLNSENDTLDDENNNLESQFKIDGENDLDLLIENNQISLDNLENVDIEQYEEFMFNSDTDVSDDDIAVQEQDDEDTNPIVELREENNNVIKLNKDDDKKNMNQSKIIKDLEIEYEKNKAQYENSLQRLLFEKNKLEEYLSK